MDKRALAQRKDAAVARVPGIDESFTTIPAAIARVADAGKKAEFDGAWQSWHKYYEELKQHGLGAFLGFSVAADNEETRKYIEYYANCIKAIVDALEKLQVGVSEQLALQARASASSAPPALHSSDASAREVASSAESPRSNAALAAVQQVASELLALWKSLNAGPAAKVDGESTANAASSVGVGDVDVESQEAVLQRLAENPQIEGVFPVYGAVKAGKSTFLSCLLRQEILPAQALPMTSIPIKVSHCLLYTSPSPRDRG